MSVLELLVLDEVVDIRFGLGLVMTTVLLVGKT
jgi:hypothetical protein